MKRMHAIAHVHRGSNIRAVSAAIQSFHRTMAGPPWRYTLCSHLSGLDFIKGNGGGILFFVPRLIERRTLTPTPPAGGRPWSVGGHSGGGQLPSVSQTFCGGGRALEAFSKTRILLVGFGYHETNFRKLTEINNARNMLCERWYSMRRAWV